MLTTQHICVVSDYLNIHIPRVYVESTWFYPKYVGKNHSIAVMKMWTCDLLLGLWTTGRSEVICTLRPWSKSFLLSTKEA